MNDNLRKVFYNETAAWKYMRWLRAKGYNANVYQAYNWAEQSVTWTVAVLSEV